ncbi:hypothetical protein [Vibrio cholerae]
MSEQVNTLSTQLQQLERHYSAKNR